MDSRMPVQPIIETIRKGLIGTLNDFVEDAGFHSQINLIVELVYELAEYREENVPFFPSVYVIKRVEQFDTLSIIAPGADRIFLRSGELAEGFGSQVLKDSAALADGGWSIYIDVTEDIIRYGLFRSEVLPISLSSAEHMADPDQTSGSGLLIRNCARNCVELMSSDGKRLELGLTASRPGEGSVAESYRMLAMEATRSISEETRDAAAAYLHRTISEVCQRCHGTMVVIISAETEGVPDTFQDGVVLDEPIDLLVAFDELRGESSAAALARLAAREIVMHGMIHSDGITVLNSRGQLLAFRVFVKPSEEERVVLDKVDVRGGARSRAFEILRLRVGATLSCAFFRSQDGNTKCVVKNG